MLMPDEVGIEDLQRELGLLEDARDRAAEEGDGSAYDRFTQSIDLLRAGIREICSMLGAD